MSLSALIGAGSACVCAWSLIATGVSRWLEVPAYAHGFGVLAMGSFALAALAFLAVACERSGPWFECYLCHGSYLRHEVEPIAGRGHACDACLAADSPRFPEAA